MRLLSALDLKVLRDAWRLRGQLAAIGGVIACGLGVFVGMRATMTSLQDARTTYYAERRFGDVFVRVVRAPERVAQSLAAVPGVRRVQTRVVADVTLDVPGVAETATGRLVSLPEHGEPVLNGVHLRSGRFPAPGRWREVVVSEVFAEATGLGPGARLETVLNGKREVLEIVGTGLSPEYVRSVGPGLLMPDDRRFGVLWIRRPPLAAAFDMEGAFNDASLRLARGARVPEVLARVDELLERYGGGGAITRADQESAFFVENELDQLATYVWMVPSMFLAVAAFLLNVVIGRIVAGQREQISALKALGYRDAEVGAHYAKLIGLVVLVGCAAGLVIGAWLGDAMTRMYVRYYRFPDLPFGLGSRAVLQGVAVSALAAALGTWAAIRRVVALPPAEGLRPEPPPSYGRSLVDRLRIARRLPTGARLVVRELERRPLRAVFSVVAIALAAGLTVMNAFTLDSVLRMFNVQFGLQQREDVTVTLTEPRSLGVLSELRALPGVFHAEPSRTVPVELRHGVRVERVGITGIPAGARLQGLLDPDLRDVPVPDDGLVLTTKLAELLAARAGDTLTVRVLEGARPTLELPVARVVESYVGLSAHMELAALCRVLGEPPTLNAARLVVDDARLPDLHAAVKRTPVVAGATDRDAVLRSARELIDQNIGAFVAVSLSFSLVMAFGVLYNAVRVTLAERSHELASLRVLGFRRGEVAALLLGELGLLVGAALPLGLLAGRAMAQMLVSSPGYDTDQFRLPLVVSPATYAMAVLTVLAAGAVSSWSAWRKLERIDIVEVLKARD